MMIDRWPFRHGAALGIGVLVLLGVIVVAVMQAAADRALPMGYAGAGEYTFAEQCAACHGHYAAGTESGPALTAGEAPPDAGTVERSVREGEGAMAAVAGLEDQDIADVAAFLREIHTETGGYP
jgi:mono/diheme cytochrome c family protein